MNIENAHSNSNLINIVGMEGGKYDNCNVKQQILLAYVSKCMEYDCLFHGVSSCNSIISIVEMLLGSRKCIVLNFALID